MPLSNAVAKAADLFTHHSLVGAGNYSITVQLGFSLTLSVTAKGDLLTINMSDKAENSLFPAGLLMKVEYIFVHEDDGFIRPFQEYLVINTFDVYKFSSLSVEGVELAYTQLALVSEVLAIIFEKLRTINLVGDDHVHG